MKTDKIDFRDCPSEVCNYYDKGPSDQRVFRSFRRTYSNYSRGIETTEYVVVHNYGRDYWRQDQWRDWTLWKSSPPLKKGTNK